MIANDAHGHAAESVGGVPALRGVMYRSWYRAPIASVTGLAAPLLQACPCATSNP